MFVKIPKKMRGKVWDFDSNGNRKTITLNSISDYKEFYRKHNDILEGTKDSIVFYGICVYTGYMTGREYVYEIKANTGEVFGIQYMPNMCEHILPVGSQVKVSINLRTRISRLERV